MMQTAVKTKKPRKQAVSGRFWAMRTYRGRIKDDHKIDVLNWKRRKARRTMSREEFRKRLMYDLKGVEA